MNKEIKELYNQNISEVYKNQYEFKRWFSSHRLTLDYSMMYRKILFTVTNMTFESCFELGPGPGTWTRILFKKNPSADYTLVDISEEMRMQFKLEMRSGNSNVSYEISDFLDYQTDKKFDLFFSSRAVEYIKPFEEVVKKIKFLLRDRGAGVIVTKNPKYFKFGKDKRSQHQNQISPERMKLLLEQNGFTNIVFSPCIVRIAVVDRLSTYFSEYIFKKSLSSKNQKISRFCESYIVTFVK
jgi:trans-aconitate methyltransferase